MAALQLGRANRTRGEGAQPPPMSYGAEIWRTIAAYHRAPPWAAGTWSRLRLSAIFRSEASRCALTLDPSHQRLRQRRRTAEADAARLFDRQRLALRATCLPALDAFLNVVGPSDGIGSTARVARRSIERLGQQIAR